MEVMPGYKQTEVGVIPEDWRVVAVEEIASVGRGRVISHKDIARARNPQYPIYSSQTSNDGVMGHIDTFDFEGEYITWTTDGANAGTVFARDGRFNCTNVCGTIKLTSDNHSFVALMLAGFAPRHVSRHLGNPKLMNDIMKRVKIPLPSTREEQRAIATALSDVDALLGGLDRLIAKKRDLKQAAMQQLLTGQTRLPGFHGEWETLPARDIGVLKGGSGFPLATQGETGGQYPFFKVSDMNNEGNETFMTTANHYISEQTRKRLGATAFPADSIVFAKVGAAVFLERKRILGQASCIDNNMAAFVLDKTRADVGYVHSLLLSKKLGALVATTALPALNAKQLCEMPLAVPPLSEQTAIAAALSDMDTELAALEARRDKTRYLKQAIMQELLTGKTRLVPAGGVHA
jgi:type I restriction enzyme S subunit